MRLASLTSALVLVGCANQGDEGMIVLNNTAVSGESCLLTGEAGQAFISHGQIHAQSPVGYTLTPLIQSRVTAQTGGMGSADLLQKTISLRGADVKLTVEAVEIEQGGVFMGGGKATVAPFSVLFSGSLPPNGTVNVGFEVIPAAQIRNIVTSSGVNLAAGQSLKAEVLAEVTIHGDLAGDGIEASPFFFPISVCTGCVVVNLGACPITTTARTGNACNPFQDGIVDCCVDATNRLVCPAPMQ